ncbi:VOC family protein [Zeaxanthinibacter enoshimensis]|uniref:Catechol 2,3-dioxygenase-like lactoylglutathione lyase family enzyme n=1 Tax=Zeaxanthinibacter enoshimensis TaxID=392009 RepID=A0A4R6TSR8_9FLAO|nr:VOC family protein [Zeaxanthinibacter enoshimensis]TDQ33367.1 catechol 2,3-dioxygenase-like lactoylglutathione lyase family enzyme [Zeaxanthinibacter enoshimensis]
MKSLYILLAAFLIVSGHCGAQTPPAELPEMVESQQEAKKLGALIVEKPDPRLTYRKNWRRKSGKKPQQSKAKLGVAAIGIVVSDINASLDFYKNVLGMVEVGEFELDADWSAEAGAANNQPFKVKRLKQKDNPAATEIKLAYFEEPVKRSDLGGINDRAGVNYLTFYYSAKDFQKILDQSKKFNIQKLGWVKRDAYQLVFLRDPDNVFIEIVSRKER